MTTNVYSNNENDDIQFNTCAHDIYQNVNENEKQQSQKEQNEIRTKIKVTVSLEKDILMFGDEQNISQFMNCQILFVDGTFKVCPSLLIGKIINK